MRITVEYLQLVSVDGAPIDEERVVLKIPGPVAAAWRHALREKHGPGYRLTREQYLEGLAGLLAAESEVAGA